MLRISNAEGLSRASSLLDNDMQQLLRMRLDQLGGDVADSASFHVVQPGDGTAYVYECLGFSVFQAADGTRYGDTDYSGPGFEWIQDHGFCWELVFQFTEDFTHVVFVENQPDVSRRFVRFCEAFAPQVV